MTNAPKLSDALRRAFDAGVRRRGADYSHQGRVSIVEHGETYLAGQVRGSKLYHTSVLLDDITGTASIACTCPYYADRGPCKHIWATVLAAEQAGLLSSDAIPNSIDLPDEDDFFEPDFGDEPDFDESNLVAFRPAPDWRQEMTLIQRSGSTHRPSRDLATHRIYYVLNVAEILHGQRMVEIEIQSTRPRKNKDGWTKRKPLKLADTDIRELDDPADREIITLLTSTSFSAYDYYPSYHAQRSRFNISCALFDHLLPLLSGTGRFGWSTILSSDSDWHPLTFDEGEPWQFKVEVTRDADIRSYVVSGLLTRGSQRMALSDPVLLLGSGWVFTQSAVARLDHGDAFSWICHLREKDRMLVPEGEIDDWLIETLKCPIRPRMALPAKLQWEEIAGQPEPMIKIFRPDSGWRHRFVGAAVSFRYNDAVFDRSETMAAFFVPKTRKLLLRDTRREDALCGDLLGLGFREPRYSHSHTYPEPVDFELHARALPDAVRALTHAGWEVEAQGAKCRAGPSVSISVQSSGIDWFELDGMVDFDGAQVPFPKALEALRKGENMLRLDDGTLGIMPEDWLKRYGLLAGAGKDLRFKSCQTALLDALLAAEENVVCDEGFLTAREEIRSFSSIKPEDAAPGFGGRLRPYQKDGLGWMSFLDRLGFGGCLADDMGLGKTVQALAMLHAGQTEKNRPSLIVVPKSIVMNWMAEAERFAPKLKLANHTGTQRARSADGLQDCDVVVTTYGTMRSDILWLKDIAFNWIILDEAQAIKNPATATAKAARLLKARRRLAMSGTPIENHLGELWSLFEFLNPGMLGASSLFAKAQGASGTDIDESTRELLRNALRPFILRRTKEQVASDLPDKVEETIFCEMPKSQSKVYSELRDHYRKALTAKIDKSGLKRNKIMVLEALLRLRQAACHPGLLDRSMSRQSSAKLDLLLEQIEDVTAEGHKMLVFSQFTSMLAIVRARLDSRGTCYEYLDGRTRKRAARVERFQSDDDCRVFLISLKAGGLGLNLTAADYVVLLDPWWNPAVEAQAIDRAHRIGQVRKVFAYRLVSKGTVEERILELQKAKRELADSIIAADNSLIRNLTREDLELLLS